MIILSIALVLMGGIVVMQHYELKAHRAIMRSLSNVTLEIIRQYPLDKAKIAATPTHDDNKPHSMGFLA